MDGKFLVEFPLRYQDTDPHLHATLPALVGILQEAAILHAEAIGRGIRYLSARGLSWMLTQTQARILRRPHYWNRIRVTTWPSEIGRLLSRREFELSDETGRTLLLATTLWAFVNTSERRVTRVPPEVASAYQVIAERALDLPFRRPARAESFPWSRCFDIHASHIDFNEHVNNLRYLDWMQETLPEDIATALRVRDLNIRYQKETGREGAITARSGEIVAPEVGTRRLSHEVTLNGAPDPVAIAETTWVPRDEPCLTR